MIRVRPARARETFWFPQDGETWYQFQLDVLVIQSSVECRGARLRQSEAGAREEVGNLLRPQPVSVVEPGVGVLVFLDLGLGEGTAALADGDVLALRLGDARLLRGPLRAQGAAEFRGGDLEDIPGDGRIERRVALVVPPCRPILSV